jgi:hypothetical protein
MKRVVHQLFVFGMLTILTNSCSKDHSNPSSGGTTGKPTIVGKWTIVNVTTIAYDSTGVVLDHRGNVYTDPPNNFFTFNSDGTWSESLLPDTLADEGLGGTYRFTSDSNFVLTNPKAITPDEPCSIDSLTTSLFVFRTRRAANFDGTIPGWLERVFRMKK